MENISKEREEASCLLLHDMWPSVAISDFPLGATYWGVTLWIWVVLLQQEGARAEVSCGICPSVSKLSLLWTNSSYCVHCLCCQLHWRHLRGHALPCLPKKTVPVIAAHSPQIIIESVPRHFQTSLNLSRLPLLLRNCSRLRLFQLSRFGQEVQFYQGFTR